MPSHGSGHFPLTHYERTKKFKSSNYGTTTTRLSGDTQVQFGYCALSLAPIRNDDETSKSKDSVNDTEATTTTIAMVTPSGHLYGKQAIYEYLLTKNAEYKEQMTAYEEQQQQQQYVDPEESAKRQREEFEQANSNKRVKTVTTSTAKGGEPNVLKRTSYWLPTSQPAAVDVQHKAPDRPCSPYSGEPLKRKNIREVELVRKVNSEDVLCAVSEKAIRNQPTVAYWTKGGDKNKPGVVVLKEVYDMTIAESDTKKKKSDSTNKKEPKLICPLTNLRIKHTIELTSGGSGFAAHNAVQVKTYKPTIT